MRNILKRIGVCLLIFTLTVTMSNWPAVTTTASATENSKETGGQPENAGGEETQQPEEPKDQEIQTDDKITMPYRGTKTLKVTALGLEDENPVILSYSCEDVKDEGDSEETPEGTSGQTEDGDRTPVSITNNSSVISLAESEAEPGVVEIKAVGVGTAEITIHASATENYKEGTKKVTVVVDKAEQVIQISDLTLKYSEEPFQLKPELVPEIIKDSDGNVDETDQAERKITYSSSNEKVAEVDENGLLTIHGLGTTTIRMEIPESEHYKGTVREINVTIQTSLPKPAISDVVNQDGSVLVTWEKVKGADGYYVYRALDDGDKVQVAKVVGQDTVSYTETNVQPGVIYRYWIKAYASGEKDVSDYSSRKSVKYLSYPWVSTQMAANGNEVNWTSVEGASGYFIYRKKGTESDWTQIQQISGKDVTSWRDTSVSNGKEYTYTVQAYYGSTAYSRSVYGPSSTIYRLKSPTVKKLTRVNSKKIKVQWSKNNYASGYQIQYSRNRFFHDAATISIYNNQTVTKTLSKLEKNKTYYVRIRAYRYVDGTIIYSSWSAYKNVKTTKTATATRLKKGKKVFELRKYAKQVLYQYDTVQGSCTDGKYGYFIMYNRKVEKCKIVKIKLSNRKVAAVSGVLEVAHGNDMTYNSDTKQLVVVHNTKNPKRLSIVSPKTLTVIEQKDLTFPSKIPGSTAGGKSYTVASKTIKGFTGISYNAVNKKYVLLLKTTGHLLIMDNNFQPVVYIEPTKKYGYTMQGIDTTEDYILVAQSGSQNLISVYNWDGEYIGRVNVLRGYEMESIFHAGSQYYASFYRSYYKVYYTKEKKTVYIRGKKKKTTVKVRHRQLTRDNYLYKIGNF